MSFFKGYKAVLFDLDGVFVDSTRGWIIALQRILRKHNYARPSDAEISRIVAKSTRGQIEELLPHLMAKPEKFNALVNEIDDYFMDIIPQYVRLFDKSHQILAMIKDLSIPIALVTNNRTSITSRILTHFDLTKYFNYVIALEDMGNPKPDPTALFLTIRKLGVSMNDVIYIGDSPSDLEASLRANVDFILIKAQNSSFVFPKIPSKVRIVSGLGELLA